MSRNSDKHHQRKYSRIASRSRWAFKTVFGHKQAAQLGSTKAKADIERELGTSLTDWVPAHTKHLWRWKKMRPVAA